MGIPVARSDCARVCSAEYRPRRVPVAEPRETSETELKLVAALRAGDVAGAERMLVDLASHGKRREHVVALFTPSAALRDLFRRAGPFR